MLITRRTLLRIAYKVNNINTSSTIFYLDMGIVRLKTFNRDQTINELLNMFKLPCVDYSQGYKAKPRSELTGGSAAMNSVEAYRLKAVNELLRWTTMHSCQNTKRR